MNINKQDIEKAQQAASARWGNWVKYVIGAIIGALAAAGYIMRAYMDAQTKALTEINMRLSNLEQYARK